MAQRFDRRTFLRGTGSVAVALPFLEEMVGSRAFAATPETVPFRLITVFFGLGLDPAWQRDFNGPLEPYLPFQKKMTFASVGLEQGGEGGAHCNTSSVVFVGEKHPSANRAGGASVDQLARLAFDPTAKTLVSGLWWRRGACDAQALRVWNPDGTARPPVKRPSQVFDQVFGKALPRPDSEPNPQPDPAALRARHIQRSILDTVIQEYKKLTGKTSYLGSASKQKIDLHLNSIREIERELAPSEEIMKEVEDNQPTVSCDWPTRPTDPSVGSPEANYDQFTYGTGAGAPKLRWQEIERVFHLHADLYALALRCDLVRYGNLMFESAGGHTNIQGTYRALGESTDFPGNASQHDDYFHGNQPRHARLYQHFAQSNVAYFLQQLDDPAFLEPNGKTVLDNTCAVIGTEYGWNHSKTDVFHAIAGGHGRFKSGNFTDRKLNGIDLYNAILSAYGIEARIGSKTGVQSEGNADFLLA